MNKELDKKLCAKYPKIFRDRNAPMTQTCMCWGLEHGDGWYDIIDSLCEALEQTYTTSIDVSEESGKKLGLKPDEYQGKVYYSLPVEAPQVIASQVKEKFGTLRFYHNTEFEMPFRELAFGENADPKAREIAERYMNYIDGIVHYAEVLSARTCEETGRPGELHQRGGWYKTLNRDFAKTDASYAGFVPVADLPKKE